MTVSLKLNKFIICPKCGSTEYTKDSINDTKVCKKCKDKMQTIMLKKIMPDRDLPDNCTFCGKEGDENDELSTIVDGVHIFRCKDCGELDGFLVLDEYYSNDEDDGFCMNDSEHDDRQYKHKEIITAEQEGKLVFSAAKDKEILKALKKHEKSPKVQKKKLFDELFREKYNVMLKNGIDPEIVRKATAEVRDYIGTKGMFTKKQLESLLSAAVTLNIEDITFMGSLRCPKITERQMENIFNVDRKTMRKWKKILLEKTSPRQLIVYSRKGLEEFAHCKVEVPNELLTIKKLSTPKEGRCDFCEKRKLLVWKVEYAYNRWSQICQESYEKLKQRAVEEKWATPNLND